MEMLSNDIHGTRMFHTLKSNRTDEVVSYEVLLSLTQPKGKGQQKGTAKRG